MLMNSLHYLLFFTLITILFYLLPQKAKKIFLVLASYFFYACFAPSGLIILITITVIAYIAALLINKLKLKKMIMLMAIVLCTMSLFVFKYYNLGVTILEFLFSKVRLVVELPKSSLFLPVGISFFTFQAVGYIVDVYKGKVSVQKDFIRVASFISFFPTISSGPIMRAEHFFDDLCKEKVFDYEKCRRGLLLIAYGIIQKMVIADRLAILVNNVFANYKAYRGMELLIAAFAFSIEIYCDFAGYSNMAIGTAEILGFSLKKNFDCPYFAKSVSEFWRRWHISLSSWFRDYLYIPLGGNRKGKIRKYINLMIVFGVSGLWHGSSLKFVIWGGLNGFYQVIGEMTMPLRKKVNDMFHINRERRVIKLMNVIGTFVLVTYAWIFFKADTFSDACGFISLMFDSFNPAIFIDGTIYTLGLDSKEMGVVVLSLVSLFLIDLCRYKNIDVRGIILRQPIVCRWIIYYVIIFVIIIFGIYGGTYDVQNFIYFKF